MVGNMVWKGSKYNPTNTGWWWKKLLLAVVSIQSNRSFRGALCLSKRNKFPFPLQSIPRLRFQSDSVPKLRSQGGNSIQFRFNSYDAVLAIQVPPCPPCGKQTPVATPTVKVSNSYSSHPITILLIQRLRCDGARNRKSYPPIVEIARN